MLASPRFVDRSPAEVVATLLDEGQYLCAERTMYRILAANQPVRERRNQRSHPCYTKPELVATGPNQTWSWDITRLRGPKRWTSFYLYVLLDIFSRCVVAGWLPIRENAALAATLIEETCLKQGIEPQVLTLHSDRGAPMTSKCTAHLLADLGVTRSLSRPQVSDDNPFSEAQFKTLKYHPGFPGASKTLPPPSPSAGRSSPGTTPSTAMPGSRCSPPMMSIITEHRMCWLSADVPCKPPGPFTPNASSTAPRNPPRFPKRLDQTTRHFHNRRNESVNRNRRCLKVVDRFRGGFRLSVEWQEYVDLGLLRDMAMFRNRVSSNRSTRTFQLGSVHLKPEDPARGAEMTKAVDWLVRQDEVPAIVAGDFNWGYRKEGKMGGAQGREARDFPSCAGNGVSAVCGYFLSGPRRRRRIPYQYGLQKRREDVRPISSIDQLGGSIGRPRSSRRHSAPPCGSWQ